MDWGREALWDDSGERVWVSREAVPDGREALALAAVEMGFDAAELEATAVLVREESEVEARINGHEWPYYVECTTRARRAEPFWRIEVTQSDLPSPTSEEDG